MIDIPRPENMPRRALELEVARSRVTIAYHALCALMDESRRHEYRRRYDEARAECERVEAEEVVRD
jgi:hypothetical protein